MPRRSSGGRSGRSTGFSLPRSASKPAARAPAPAPASAQAPAAAPMQSGSVMGGLGSVVAEGMAFGGGSAIAHRAVDSLMGPRVVKHETMASASPSAEVTPVNNVGGSDACSNQYKAFQDCLNSSGSEISRCQFYMDMLSDCRKSSASGLTV